MQYPISLLTNTFLQNIVLYAAAFVVLGYIIYAIDAALPAKTALTGETHKGR